MKQLTLTKLSGRILELNLSQRDGGFTPRESRKWRAIATKILDAVSDYDGPVQELADEARDAEFADLTAEERTDRVREINRAIIDLDETLGTETVTIVLESEEYDFLNKHWWDLKFSADRKTSQRIEAVSSAIEGAVDVTISEGKVVPVEHTPTPLKQRKRG